METKLRERLDGIIMEYIKLFEKKHNMNFEFAVSDDLTDVLCFGDIYYFSMNDVVFDIDNKLKKGLTIEWLEYNLENQDKYVNLYSYSKGYRHNLK